MLLAAVALGFGAAERSVPFHLWSTGLLDEISHLATAALGLLVLACLVDVPRRFYVAALIASVAIDLDHIPDYLGLLGDQPQRPVTHSLATVALFAGAAVASRRHRAVLAGAVAGLLLHFARDIAAFTGLRLVLAHTGIPGERPRLCQTRSSPAREACPGQASAAPGNPGARA